MPTKNYFNFVFLLSVLFIVGLICGYVIWLSSNLLRQSPEEIRRKLLEDFPIKSSLEQVIVGLKANKLDPKISRTAGFLKQEKDHRAVIGTKSIRVHLGDYFTFPFFTKSVSVFFGFNDEEELIEIWVWKTTDTP